MIDIDTNCYLEYFRNFLISSTCSSYIPESYAEDNEVFPEREDEIGTIYIEAVDKVTLKKIREINFINAEDVLGIIYVSKSGNTKLKWRQVRGKNGKISGIASGNSIVNLITTKVITQEYAEELAQDMIAKVKK